MISYNSDGVGEETLLAFGTILSDGRAGEARSKRSGKNRRYHLEPGNKHIRTGTRSKFWAHLVILLY